MKRIFCLTLCAVLVLTMFAGCEKKQPQAAIPGTPGEIIEKIYAAYGEIDLALVGLDVDLTDADAVKYYSGLDSGDKLVALSVSETMLGQPYSLVVARVKNPGDAIQVGKDMFNKIDERKWICVAADTRTAAVCGDVVMFFMVNSEYADVVTTEAMLAAFQTLGTTTVIA